MRVYPRFLPYLRPYRARFIQACVAMIAVAVFNGASVYVLKPIVDRVFISRDFHTLWLAIVGVPLLVAAKTMVSYAQNYLMAWIGQRVTQELREDLFRRLHSLPLDFFHEHRSGEALARATNDLNTVQATLTSVPLYLIRDSLTVLVLTTVLFSLDWRFAALALSSLPAASVTMFVLGRKMRASSLQSQIMMGRIYHRFQESLQTMPLIKTNNYEEGAIEKFREDNLLFFNETMRYLRATALAAPLMELAGAVVVSLLLYYGGTEIIGGKMTTGAFFAFMGAFYAAYAPMKNLARLNSELQRGLASGERIFQLLDERPVADETAASRPWTRLERGVAFQDVSFRYPGRDRPALKGVSLELRRGEVTALVGPSGSGKTTLAQLLLRLHEPLSGRILFDDAPLAELSARAVRDRVAIVPQDAALLNDTVLQNLTLGRNIVTLSGVEAAVAAAGAAEFISALPQGYQTPLGDRGLLLSGGQRQRIGLARAILKNPELLILDEATSSLDADAASEVEAALERLMAGRTVLLIAHRLAAVARADRIYVLSAGEVVEHGSHDELIGRAGLYRRLHDLQTASPAPCS